MTNNLSVVREARDAFYEFYEQGLEHSERLVKTLSLKYKLPEAFLLELSVELNKLKKVLEPTESR